MNQGLNFSRYVAIGDSLTEGLGDKLSPDGTPGGWTDRVAATLSTGSPQMEYANLAIRGQTSDRVRDTQLENALYLKPDLVTVTAGMNDMLRKGYTPEDTSDTVEEIVAKLRESGAQVLLLPLPDLTGLLPIGGMISNRVASLNQVLEEMAEKHGALITPRPPRSVFGDPRLWSEDRLHLSDIGHTRVSIGVLQVLDPANTLGLKDIEWDRPLPKPLATPSRIDRAKQSATWWAGFALPWIGRRLTGRSSGDNRIAKRPNPLPLSESERSFWL